MPPTVKTFLYADDTALVVNGTDLAEVSNKLNDALRHANTWFKNHRLSLNLSKTQIMIQGTHQRLRDAGAMPPVMMHSQQVENVTEFKYLGVIM